MTDEYDVGYKKPPKRTRFKKGKSGNPRGRPRKKRETTVEDIKELLNAEVTVTQNGKKLSKHPKFIELQSLLKRYLEHRDYAAFEYLMKTLKEYGCMPKEQVNHYRAVLELPDTEEFPYEKSLLIFQEYGTFDLTPAQLVDMEHKWALKQIEEKKQLRRMALNALGRPDDD